MKLPTDILSGVLGRPNNAMFYELSRKLRSLSSDLQILETDDYDFEPVRFANFGGCELLPRETPSGHWKAEWIGNQLVMTPESAVLDVHWRGNALTLIRVSAHSNDSRWFILAKSLVLCEQFFSAVCRWESEACDSIIQYSSSNFHNAPELREAISLVTIDSVFLEDPVLNEIQKGILGFFSQKDRYKEVGIPWKRGVILHGPPGNGKTRLIKALINETKLPAIYVRSLYHREDDLESCIREIYARARDIAPCFVIWEDIDSLVTPKIRSAFLNELDGFSPLNGVLTLATTNHLDKLDVAIKDRPSRFDVKIELPNPSFVNRYIYLCRVLGHQYSELAKLTEGCSFAALQEVVTSVKVLAGQEQSVEEIIRSFARKRSSDSEKKKEKKKK